MTPETLQARLTDAKAQQAQLFQQRARLTELLDQTLAQLNQSQGRIAELAELIALETPEVAPSQT